MVKAKIVMTSALSGNNIFLRNAIPFMYFIYLNLLHLCNSHKSHSCVCMYDMLQYISYIYVYSFVFFCSEILA